MEANQSTGKEAAQGSASASGTTNNNNGSQRSSRSRKANIKSQGGKVRVNSNSAAYQSAIAGSEYSKQGSANQKSQRGESEASRRIVKNSGSGMNLIVSTSKEQLAQEAVHYRTQAGGGGFEEAKKTISSKSNSIVTTSKKSGAEGASSSTSKVVGKKKKSKPGGSDSRETNKNSSKGKRLPQSIINMNTNESLTGEGNNSAQPGNVGIKSANSTKTKQQIKSTSSASMRNNTTSGNMKNKTGSSAGRSPTEIHSSSQSMAQKGVTKGDVGQKPSNMALHQVMQSTIKSGLSGANNTISNWDQSQQSESNHNMASTGAIPHSTKASELRNSQKDAIGSGVIQGQSPRQGDQSNPSANQPASPASKTLSNGKSGGQRPAIERPAPLNLEAVQQDNMQRHDHESITEMEEDSPSPVSAGPILSPDRNENTAANFGIKLQKLEVTSNMSVTRPKEGSTAALALNNQNSVLSKLSESGNKHGSILEPVVNSPPDSPARGAAADGSPVRPELTEPLPILPKVTTMIHMPVKCPMENIRFVNLKRFQHFQKQLAEMMSAGYDLVGQRRKMIQLKTEDKIKKGGNGIENQDQLAKIDDTTHFIKSIVFARDPKIIDPEMKHVNQRDAFSHLNNCDVKTLVSRSQLLGEEGKYPSLSPRNIRTRLPRDNTSRPALDCQVYKLKDADDKTLLFESRFESGNLYLAQKVSEAEYNLLMSNDINTQGHTQWFFFQVRNTKAKSRIRFNILNYSKPDSLFNYGMKVSVYSDKKSEKKDIGWHKDGEDIRYFQNGIRKDVTYYSKSYYTATFTYTFEYDDDLVYFAYSVPYTYTDLRNDLAAIETDPNRAKLVRKATLCRTLSGEPCEVLTITAADNLENFRKRKGVVITARVHPGETVGSWMMRGVLTFLTDPDNIEARMLRENFVFKVVPMLNPDGVINGNYRCSLAGCDLNRRWKTPNKTLHPTIFHTKRLVKQIHQERGLVLYCDLHGHSRKQNVFMYGCNNKQNPGECRIYPFILSKMNPYFCYEYSRFGVQKSKESTARVALYKELKNVPNIFTMESSFAGCDMGSAAGKHLTTQMLETLGHDCCRSILIYCNLYVPPELHNNPFFKNILLQQQAMAAAKKKGNAQALDKKKFKEPTLDIKSAIMGEINSKPELCANGGGDDSSSGSDSAPSEDNMQAEDLIKQLPTADKTLKQQLKKNQEKRKQDEVQQNQSKVQLRMQSSGKNLKKEEPPKRQMSPFKRPLIKEDKKEEKPEEKKKPKVETRDAQTQTDRSDYHLIKQKQLKERRLKEEQAALAAQQKAAGGLSKEQQMINEMNGRAQDYFQAQKQAASQQQQQKMNTSQRLQQMVSASDNKSRSNAQKMPLSQHFQQAPLNQIKQPGTNRPIVQNNGLVRPAQQSGPIANTTRNDSQPPLNANTQRIMIPDKNKYNFMGVSSIKQGTQQLGQAGVTSYNTAPNDNEYGTNSASIVRNSGFPSSNNLSPVRNDGSMLANASQNLYQVQQQNSSMIKQNAKIQETMQIGQAAKNIDIEIGMNKGASRGKSGGTGELPAMTTLNGNTNSSFKENKSKQQSLVGAYNSLLPNSVSNNPTSRMPKGSNNFSMAQRSQNFESEPATQRQGNAILSPTVKGNLQFMLPQTKQLPQKEFVMMDIGQSSKNGRKASRNPKGGTQSSVGQNHAAAAEINHAQMHQGPLKSSQLTVGKLGAQGSLLNGHQSSTQPTLNAQSDHVSRFNSKPQQQANNMQGMVNIEQTLARNNSTHCNPSTSGKYAAPLGASPLSKTGPTNVPPNGVNPSPADQYSTQLQEMNLSQSLVTRNTTGAAAATHQPGNGIQGGSVKTANSHSVTGTQPLRGSMNAHQTPQGKKGSWNANNSQQLESSAGRQYRAMGGGSLPHSNLGHNQQLEHSEQCSSKLPALNMRGPQKSTRTNPNGTNSHLNASGMIGGLNIVLNSGQGTLQTPSQKKPYQIAQHSKFQTQLIQPQLIGTQMHVVNQGSEQKQPSTQSVSRHKQTHSNWQSNHIMQSKNGGATVGNSSQVAGGTNANSSVNGNGPAGTLTGAETSNNTSSATHKRNARGAAIFSMNGQVNAKGGSLLPQNTSEQKMIAPSTMAQGGAKVFYAKSGSRTPSQQEINRSGKGGSHVLEHSDFMPAQTLVQPNKHTLNFQNSPIKSGHNHTMGAMSLDSGQIQELDAQSPVLRGRGAPATDQQFKQKAGSMVNRMRNQSEMSGEHSRHESNNYGTYDARGLNGQNQGGKYGGHGQSMPRPGAAPGQSTVGQVVTNPQMMAPTVNLGKRGAVSNSQNQGKVVGKRYSRH